MPILFVIRQSREQLLTLLKRVVERPGLVTVIVDRRVRRRRHRVASIAFPDRRERCRRQPLDGTAARTWQELGFVVRQVRTVPTPGISAASTRARSTRGAVRPAAATRSAPRRPRRAARRGGR